MRWMYLTLIAVTVCISAALLRGDDSATTKPSGNPSASATTKPTAGGRLFSPYSKLTDLTDDQKEKIRDIHKKALADIHDINMKEADDIAALLSDDQKQELKTIEQQKTPTEHRTNSSSGNKNQGSTAQQ